MTQTTLNFFPIATPAARPETVTDAMFCEIRDALCPWSEGFAATRGAIGDRELDRIWGTADGYGHVSLRQLRADGLTRDWSHIRDASDSALFRIWARLERRGIVK